MPDLAVRDVVAELAAENTHGFRASYIAKRTGRPVAEIQTELVEMVDRGELVIEYQLLCPDDGAVLGRYGVDDPLPLGESVQKDDCDEFVVTKRDIWVSYKPTPRLTADLLKEARQGKAPARRRGLRRRALAALGTNSKTREHWSLNATTTFTERSR
jgi:hypothetical protein